MASDAALPPPAIEQLIVLEWVVIAVSSKPKPSTTATVSITVESCC